MILDDKKAEYVIIEGWLTSDVRPKRKAGKNDKKRLPLGFRPRSAETTGKGKGGKKRHG